MADEILNLEEFAESTEEYNANEKKESDTEVKKKKDFTEEMETIFKFPFEVAVQNLKVDKEKLIESGRQMFEKGYFEEEFKLPFGNNFTLRTSKAIDDLDYYTFVMEAIKKDMSIEEFNYLLSIRNMAKALVKFRGEDYSNKATEEKMDMLLNMSAPLVKSMLEVSKDFWSILMLMMHPGFVGFLMSETQA